MSTTTDPYDLIVIGAGMAGVAAAEKCAAAGWQVDWAALSAHMHGFTDPVPANMETNLRRHGVDTLHGTARFTGADRLDIDGTSHRFRHALITTGARPRPLDFPGAEHLIDTTAFLYLEQLPRRILFADRHQRQPGYATSVTLPDESRAVLVGSIGPPRRTGIDGW